MTVGNGKRELASAYVTSDPEIMNWSRGMLAHIAVLLVVSCGGQSSGAEPVQPHDAIADEGTGDVALVDSGPADAAEELLTTCPTCDAGLDARDANAPSDTSMVSDASDATDASMASDASDATDTSMPSDASDATDASDAGDGSDGSDSNDPRDAAPICTPGQDQTCNDNPIFASLHGHCTDERTCVCKNDAAPNTSSGRCP